VEVSTSSIEMGVGLATIQTQHIAERFGVPYERARYRHGDTDLPMSQASGGSAATASVGGAIHAAAEELTEKLLKLAQKNKQSVLHGIKRDNVELRAGGLYRRDQPAVGESFEQLLTASGQPFVEAEGSLPASALLMNMKHSMASYGAHFCEVRVHAHTRQVQVRRFVSAFDCGRIMNPQTARSQIIGGLTMGIGMALMEDAVYDERTGRLMTPSLGEYHVPVHADIPEFEVYFLDQPDPLMPMGTKPVGEVSIVGCAAAVANAVFQATGIRVRHLPITVDKLL
jgi:xanthine dehydrogenase YagR molybdenum-binding subunit